VELSISGPQESPPTTLTDFDPLCACEPSTVTEYADDPLQPFSSMIDHSDALGCDPTVSDSKSSHSGKLPQPDAPVVLPLVLPDVVPEAVAVEPALVPPLVLDPPLGWLEDVVVVALPPSVPPLSAGVGVLDEAHAEQKTRGNTKPDRTRIIGSSRNSER
jgi:hypothetical protein